MAEVKWIKITTNMFDDEKIKLIDAMPERDTIHYIWIRLLVQAGKTNSHGFIFLTDNIPYSEEMLSTIFNRPINSIRLALNTLESFGMIKIKSSFVEITNWNKYQNVEGLDKLKKQNRERQSRFRNKKNLLKLEDCNVINNVMVTQNNAIEQDKEQDKEQDIDTTTVVILKEIEKLRISLQDLNLTDEQATDIYNNSNGNLQLIMDVYNFSKTQRIENLIGWMKKMVKPGVFKQSQGNHYKNIYNNHKQKEYDIKSIERKLLGWDDEDKENEEVKW